MLNYFFVLFSYGILFHEIRISETLSSIGDLSYLLLIYYCMVEFGS